ncbi:MAG: methyltransferase domain-containing protein [Synechocystis sp.]|nr:methyltransferase domain-containing protein [Synechocystis sp.]
MPSTAVSQDLYHRIKTFYDDSSLLWESIWGEHMHHGYYGPHGNYRVERRQAQIDLMAELLAWAVPEDASKPDRILDIGCGIGGSSVYLAKKYQAEVVGVSLSPVQVNRAQERAETAGLKNSCQFHVANALDLPFESGSFDWVWSLESGEHMPNKAQFLQEAWRMLKPGGRLILATWCHRPLDPGNGPLTADERRHLQQIYDVYCLPYVISLPDYLAIAVDCGFADIKSEDWSRAVAPFWPQVMTSVFEPQALLGLLKTGPNILNAALSLRLMDWGYERGLVRFGVLTAVKPLA